MHKRQFLYLNLTHTFVSILLITLNIYLLTQSIIQKVRDCSGGFYTNRCENQTELETILKSKTDSGSRNGDGLPVLNYDWIGLNQYALVSGQLIIVIFGSISAITQNRRRIFIAILFYLVNVFQIVLIETSDERQFPDNIFHNAYILSQYSIIYMSHTITSFLLKIFYLVLVLFELVLLVIYFVFLRYYQILVDNQQVP